jgi:sugar transferase (PEP-CTERM/EpsH1 system associated)
VNILVLGSDVPATANMPGSPRLFSLCRGLAQHHRLTLVTLSRSQERYHAFLDDPLAAGVFQDIIALPSPPAADWWGQQVHRLRQEAHFVTRFRTPGFYAEQCSRIKDLFVRGGFDVIFADGLWVAQYVEGAGLGCPAIIDLHDSMTLLYLRTRQVERRWLRRLALYAEGKSIARCERALSRVFSVVVVNSPVDEAFLRTLNPAARTLTIGNGVDTDFFAPTTIPADRSTVVFTGVMSYGPNEDAAIHFGEDILPLVQEHHPEVQFWIVGKNPGERVRSLSERAGVRVTGSVPDVRPYLERASVFVCPLRYGTGIKNKLLAALAMQKPVVATRQSVEGLDLKADEHLLIAGEPQEFAAKVRQLIENPEYARSLGLRGQAFVRDNYSWESSARLLEMTLHQVVDRFRAVV